MKQADWIVASTKQFIDEQIMQNDDIEYEYICVQSGLTKALMRKFGYNERVLSEKEFFEKIPEIVSYYNENERFPHIAIVTAVLAHNSCFGSIPEAFFDASKRYFTQKQWKMAKPMLEAVTHPYAVNISNNFQLLLKNEFAWALRYNKSYEWCPTTERKNEQQDDWSEHDVGLIDVLTELTKFTKEQAHDNQETDKRVEQKIEKIVYEMALEDLAFYSRAVHIFFRGGAIEQSAWYKTGVCSLSEFVTQSGAAESEVISYLKKLNQDGIVALADGWSHNNNGEINFFPAVFTTEMSLAILPRRIGQPLFDQLLDCFRYVDIEDMLDLKLAHLYNSNIMRKLSVDDYKRKKKAIEAMLCYCRQYKKFPRVKSIMFNWSRSLE